MSEFNLEKTIILSNFFPKRVLKGDVGGTASARYCYSVWMRHLVLAHQNGMTQVPRVVAEFGPGASLGCGLAAMLCGADEYYSLDFVKHSLDEHNLRVFDELIEMFTNREPIPGFREFPAVSPSMLDFDFPAHILTDTLLASTLDSERTKRIRNLLTVPCDDESEKADSKEKIKFIAPWNVDDTILTDVGLIFSQAALEHVDELEQAYEFMHRISLPDVYMSHQIDFRSHGYAAQWNGHWQYSNFTWKLIRGRLPYLINRQPLSVHRSLCEKYGLNIIYEQKSLDVFAPISRDTLAPSFAGITEEDLVTSGAYMLSRKRTDT